VIDGISANDALHPLCLSSSLVEGGKRRGTKGGGGGGKKNHDSRLKKQRKFTAMLKNTITQKLSLEKLDMK